MTIKDNQLKKFKCNELKDIMRANKIKGVSGKKAQLLAKILSSPNWTSIREGLTVPIRAKRVFSVKQIAAQQKFAARRTVIKTVDTVAVERDTAVEKIVVKICPKGKAICDCDESEKKEIVLKKRVGRIPAVEIKPIRNLLEEENKVLRSIIELLWNSPR